MGTVLVGVVGALLGTVTGTLVGALMQKRNSQEMARRARAETLRQERTAAYAAFAGALGRYRRAQVDRWTAIHDDGDTVAAMREARAQRDAAREEYFRVCLVARTDEVRGAAMRAFDTMDVYAEVKTTEQAKDARDLTWSVMHVFADVARAELDEALLCDEGRPAVGNSA